MDYKKEDIKIVRLLDILSEPIRNIDSEIAEVDGSFRDLKNRFDSTMEFTAAMNLIGDFYVTVILGLNRQALTFIAKNIFGLDIIELGDEEMYIEGAKEYLNIITGNSKNKLHEAGLDFELSLPEQMEWGKINEDNSSIFLCRSFTFNNNSINLIIDVFQEN
ncbi:MAG: chemotaxis protein CheX [bacterium]